MTCLIFNCYGFRNKKFILEQEKNMYDCMRNVTKNVVLLGNNIQISQVKITFFFPFTFLHKAFSTKNNIKIYFNVLPGCLLYILNFASYYSIRNCSNCAHI